MRHYNMSVEENKKTYGSEEPPKYTDQFGKITAPVLIYSTEADQAILEDVSLGKHILNRRFLVI